MVHVKKVLPEYFEALRTGEKRFELRQEQPDEPTFAVGDYLAVNEYDPERALQKRNPYSGRCLLFEIRYVLRDYDLLAEGCAALSLKPVPLSFEDVISYGKG